MRWVCVARAMLCYALLDRTVPYFPESGGEVREEVELWFCMWTYPRLWVDVCDAPAVGWLAGALWNDGSDMNTDR